MDLCHRVLFEGGGSNCSCKGLPLTLSPCFVAAPSRIPVIPADELRLLRLVSTSPFGELLRCAGGIWLKWQIWSPQSSPLMPFRQGLPLLLSASTWSPAFAGEVYAAEWRGSRVAVKCLGPLLASAGRPFGDEPSRRAFLASAAPLAMLDHPNLAKVRCQHSFAPEYDCCSPGELRQARWLGCAHGCNTMLLFMCPAYLAGARRGAGRWQQRQQRLS